MSSRLAKKSLGSVSGLMVKTPCWDPLKFAPGTYRLPMSTVFSGTVSVRSWALSRGQPAKSSCRFEPGLVVRSFHLLHETAMIERGQGPVNSVERNDIMIDSPLE